jgi:hypothetical protein
LFKFKSDSVHPYFFSISPSSGANLTGSIC